MRYNLEAGAVIVNIEFNQNSHILALYGMSGTGKTFLSESLLKEFRVAQNKNYFVANDINTYRLLLQEHFNDGTLIICDKIEQLTNQNVYSDVCDFIMDNTNRLYFLIMVRGLVPILFTTDNRAEMQRHIKDNKIIFNIFPQYRR